MCFNNLFSKSKFWWLDEGAFANFGKKHTHKHTRACAIRILAKRSCACDVRAAEDWLCECAFVRGKKSTQLTVCLTVINTHIVPICRRTTPPCRKSGLLSYHAQKKMSNSRSKILIYSILNSLEKIGIDEKVICYHNISNLLWKKIVLVWEKKISKTLQILGLKASNLQTFFSIFFPHTRTIFSHSKLEILW